MARFWITVCLAVLLAGSLAWGVPPPTLDATARAEGQPFVTAVSDLGAFHLVEVNAQGLVLALDDGTGRTLGLLRLIRRAQANGNVPRFHSRRFDLAIENFSPDPGVTQRLVQAADRVAARDGGGGTNPTVRQPSFDLGPLRDLTSWMLVLAAVLCVLRRGRVTWEVRLPHLIPMAIQLTLFAYWSLYWPGVRAQLPAIGMQVVLAFATDAALSFARFGSWRLGASPLPVVFSTNLFVWLGPQGMILSILVAFATKALVHRGGRHVFNPSATGLAVTGIASYIFPDTFRVIGLFHTMSLPPNMAELILLLALLPQTRFRILPVSIAAVMALHWTGNPAILRPPIVLAVALLATDPSTIPRTDLGKVQFGLFLGFGIVVASWWLRTHGYTDDFAKVLPIPVANLLAPVFDRIGQGVTTGFRWLSRTLRVSSPPRWALRPIPNLALLALWVCLTVPTLAREKPRSFESALHWNYGTPLVVRDPDDVPREAHNPTFCRPFSFAQELSGWQHRRHP